MVSLEIGRMSVNAGNEVRISFASRHLSVVGFCSTTSGDVSHQRICAVSLLDRQKVSVSPIRGID